MKNIGLLSFFFLVFFLIFFFFIKKKNSDKMWQIAIIMQKKDGEVWSLLGLNF